MPKTDKEKFLNLVLPRAGTLHPDYVEHLTDENVSKFVKQHGSVEAAAIACIDQYHWVEENGTDNSYYAVAWLHDWGFI